jgi:hypothetical protein
VTITEAMMRGAILRYLPSFLLRVVLLATVFATAVTSLPRAEVCASEPESTAPPLEQEVRQLLQGLSAETRNQRAAAEKRLLELGPKVLLHLPAPELLPSNSVREAVRRIRLELERRQARESILPSRVSLQRPHSLAETFKEITRQTGNVVDGRGLPPEVLERPLFIPREEPPFWQVVDHIADRLSVRYEYDAKLRGLKFVRLDRNQPASDGAIGYAGAFRIEASPASRPPRPVRPQVPGKPFVQSRDTLRMTLQVRPEPRLRPLFLQFAAREITARTADGAELSPFSPDASYELSLAEGASQTPIQLDFLAPDGGERGPLTLKGQMRCTTAAGNEMFRFPGIKNAGGPHGVVSRRRGGVTVSLVRVARDKGELRVEISVAYETGGPAFESHRTWLLHNDVYLEDAARNRIDLNGGNETVQQGDGTLGIEYRFIDLPDPLPELTFVYVAPTLIIDVPLTFEIQSVPVMIRPAAGRIKN